MLCYNIKLMSKIERDGGAQQIELQSLVPKTLTGEETFEILQRIARLSPKRIEDTILAVSFLTDEGKRHRFWSMFAIIGDACPELIAGFSTNLSDDLFQDLLWIQHGYQRMEIDYAIDGPKRITPEGSFYFDTIKTFDGEVGKFVYSGSLKYQEILSEGPGRLEKDFALNSNNPEIGPLVAVYELITKLRNRNKLGFSDNQIQTIMDKIVLIVNVNPENEGLRVMLKAIFGDDKAHTLHAQRDAITILQGVLLERNASYMNNFLSGVDGHRSI